MKNHLLTKNVLKYAIIHTKRSKPISVFTQNNNPVRSFAKSQPALGIIITNYVYMYTHTIIYLQGNYLCKKFICLTIKYISN